jgi:hypothetical protein
MGIAYWRYVRYTDDGCSIYECLACKGTWEMRGGGREWKWCPMCSCKWKGLKEWDSEWKWSRLRVSPSYTPPPERTYEFQTRYVVESVGPDHEGKSLEGYEGEWRSEGWLWLRNLNRPFAVEAAEFLSRYKGLARAKLRDYPTVGDYEQYRVMCVIGNDWGRKEYVEVVKPTRLEPLPGPRKELGGGWE